MPAIDTDKLTPGERLRLIEDLCESLTLTQDLVPVTEAHKAELGWAGSGTSRRRFPGSNCSTCALSGSARKPC